MFEEVGVHRDCQLVPCGPKYHLPLENWAEVMIGSVATNSIVERPI